MPADESWYDIVQSNAVGDSPDLEQGDIIPGCPRFSVEGLGPWPPPEGVEVEIATELVRAVILTQTCDLVQEKVEWVLLAVVLPWPDARDALIAQGNTFAKSTNFRKGLVQGNLPPLSLLHKHTNQPELDWSLVDFHQLFVLPKEVVLHVAAEAGLRLRLASPYKEHLSQAFARYFMRVGLPHEARAFIKEGK